MLSHQSAAELQKLSDEPSRAVHVTVPAERQVQPVRGATMHRSRRALQAMHPSAMPPRTRIEDTILDLVDTARSLDDAVGWVTRGLGRRLTTPDRLRAALAMRSRIRWRAVLTELLSPDLAGVLSVLEHRYVRDVERPHNLPAGDRQAGFRQDGRSGYRDSLYREYQLAVELDGQLAHPAEKKWRDAPGQRRRRWWHHHAALWLAGRDRATVRRRRAGGGRIEPARLRRGLAVLAGLPGRADRDVGPRRVAPRLRRARSGCSRAPPGCEACPLGQREASSAARASAAASCAQPQDSVTPEPPWP
jgi:hypothetical protein